MKKNLKPIPQLEQEYTPEEIAESFVFPADLKGKEKEQVLTAFRAHRKKISARQSEKTKLIAQLLQLKFMMEDYIKSSSFNRNYYFGYFLKEYILRIEKKNKVFAQEIEVDPTELSQVINRHRKPTEKLIYRLDIHSNRNFPALLWFRIMEKERAFELQQDSSIIESEKKHVKHTLEFSL